ncbi:phage integrase N-terminal SAM-like domain-containing protein [Shewanella sp. TC10]|uniref:phage integrase N-terminal SAM-like domain-containing protein n=1 Tax=Shewanella sp. TC10 TaxID=1419739 RepID=UPI00129E3897|nr:phage integrase N-terminal SAM-like domain-containing protein [Shewanella sp. TC10]
MKNTGYLGSIKEQLRVRHYSYQTEKSYLYWNRYFIKHFQFSSAKQIAPSHIEQFLTFLANKKQVSSSTQQQALCALVFAFKHVLAINTDDLQFPYAKPPSRIPQVLDDSEAKLIIERLTGKYKLLGILLYGAGLRLTEALTLRIKDIDTQNQTLFIYRGKGKKDRVCILPQVANELINKQFNHVRQTITLAISFPLDSLHFTPSRWLHLQTSH